MLVFLALNKIELTYTQVELSDTFVKAGFNLTHLAG